MKTSTLTPSAQARAVARLMEYFSQEHELAPGVRGILAGPVFPYSLGRSVPVPRE